MKTSTKARFIVRRTTIGALILVILACLLGPVSPVFAAAIGVEITPSRPFAVNKDGTGVATFNFIIAYKSVPSYALLTVYGPDPSTTTYFCRFFDLEGAYGSTWNTPMPTDSCNGIANQGYVNDSSTVVSPYSKNGITWTVPDGTESGIYTVKVQYFAYDEDENLGEESFAGNTFVIAETTNIILKKFYDNNANGIKDPGEPYATTPRFELCILSPYETIPLCRRTNSLTGISTFNSVPVGLYTFTETQQEGWGQTTPALNFQDTVGSSDYTLEFGNAKSDMVCDSVAIRSPLSLSNQMIFRLNYEKLYNGITAKNPSVQLYFTKNGLNSDITWNLISSTAPLFSGDGWAPGSPSPHAPYTFHLSDITTAGTSYIDVVVELTFQGGIRPTAGTFNAFQIVGSTYEPILPDNNTCSKTVPFEGTAVDAADFSARPQASGVELSWWANPAAADWVGFKVQSKLHTAELFTDVPGAFIPADMATQGGSHYTYVDASAQLGNIDYQLVPVKAGGVEQPAVLSLGTWYGKYFIPNILK